MIEPLVEAHLTASIEIDQRVKELVASGRPLYQLNERAFHLAHPDVILTQDLCHVCAVTPDQLTRAIQLLQSPPEILTLSPTTLGNMIHDIERIARAVDRLSRGQVLATELRRRLDHINQRNMSIHSRPRVVCLEWLDPLYVAGHWVPEMIDLAGGHDVLGSKHAPSHTTTWREVETSQPDVVIVMPCGYSIDRTMNELRQSGPVQDRWRRACQQWPNLYVVDAASYFSRPGPRLVDGVELLDWILHPNPNLPIDPIKAIKLEASVLAGGCAS
jgi:iron complex transport system substrate-binding protein